LPFSFIIQENRVLCKTLQQKNHRSIDNLAKACYNESN